MKRLLMRILRQMKRSQTSGDANPNQNLMFSGITNQASSLW